MGIIKNQKGALSPVLIGVVLLVIAGVAFAGYKVLNNKKTTTSGSSNNAPAVVDEKLNDECMKKMNDKDFCKFMSKWEANESYKATFAGVEADGTTSSMNMEADGDNSSTVMIQGGQEVSAFMTVDKVSYMKDAASGVWYKMPTSDSADSETDPTSELDFMDETDTEDKTTYKKIGKEACGDKTCFKYQMIDPEDTETLESFLWFDDKDYRLIRWTTKSKDGATSDALFRYEKVSIKAPSPVQDYPGYGSN